ncbi:acyl-CoA/acyl-ACP dehydrogenase [Streptomyces sp. NBC_01456]|uniref:acyl-CoA dehydrogenase family protein n=1 Tax=unclassified Streptomyces TaxID=2593676 RepID=UPI002E323D2D|nr:MULTISPECIES: acyl-CoA dehydrogenase family protein [unclassified Streptomyces]
MSRVPESGPDAATTDPPPVEPVELSRVAADLAAHAHDCASRWDQDGGLPDSVRKRFAASGLLAADLPERYGGAGLHPLALGEITARIGGECSALRGLLTVQGMVAAALLRWGTEAQRADWLPRLAGGELTAGFAASEQGAGSALGSVETRIEASGRPGHQELVVSGRKRWVTFGAVADVFLVLGTYGGKPAAVLVDADRAGVEREPVNGQLGMRAARIAHVSFDGVRVPRHQLVAPPGLGLSHVAGTALDHGRFTVAWGCVGMAEACVEDAATHAAVRRQGDVPLGDHQLVRSLLARAAVDAAGARELARRAAEARACGPGHGVSETLMAKYAAASAAATAGRDAVQVLGSAGCAPDSRAGRHFRDAKVMEIIEGAQQVSELHIAERLLRRFGGAAHGTDRTAGPRLPGESP